MSSWELGGSGAGPARQLLMQADELARRTQKTVIIATMNGLKVQHIYLNRSQDDLTTSAPSHIGMHCSLATTALGKAQIGRAHVCTPVTNAHLVCRLLLEKKNRHYKTSSTK